MSLAFWGVAALLVAGVLACVLPPLRRRRAPAGAAAADGAVYRAQREELDVELQRGVISGAQHAQAIDELQRRALAEVGEGRDDAPRSERRPGRGSVAAIALALPAGAMALYAALGAPQAIEATAAAAQAPHTLTRAQVEVMVQKLIERLQARPDDAEGWFMLARSHLAFGRYAQAAQAYERVAALVPANPELLADLADTLAQANGGRLDGRPTELVQAALKLDPAHPKALALAGTAAYHQRAFDQAVGYWQQLQRTLPPDSEQAREIGATIAQVQRESGAAKAATPTAAPPASASISGQVSIAAALQPQLRAGDTLFVFARAASGPRMPLAVQRVPANTTWPIAFTLDDSQAMAPQMKLSSQSEVVLGARLSRSGSATPRSGDLSGSIGPVRVGQREVRLVIDSVVP